MTRFISSSQVKVWLRLTWTNQVLSWDPSTWGGTKSVRLSYGEVWTPDLFLVEEVNGEMSG